jgi:hypothetical protein
MEEAVARHLPDLTPEAAADILREPPTRIRGRTQSNVANLPVLTRRSCRPASRRSGTRPTMQPRAPFGAYVGFIAREGTRRRRARFPHRRCSREDDGARAAPRSTGRARRCTRSTTNSFAEAGRRASDALIAETQRRDSIPRVLALSRRRRPRFRQSDYAGRHRRRSAPSLGADTPVDARIYATSARGACAGSARAARPKRAAISAPRSPRSRRIRVERVRRCRRPGETRRPRGERRGVAKPVLSI